MARPELKSYFTSRGACMGQVPGEVIAAAAPWAGRPIFGGLRSLGFPSHPLREMWRAEDLLREHRGDSHVSCCRLTGGSSCRFPCLLPSEAMASGKGREAGS